MYIYIYIERDVYKHIYIYIHTYTHMYTYAHMECVAASTRREARGETSRTRDTIIVHALYDFTHFIYWKSYIHLIGNVLHCNYRIKSYIQFNRNIFAFIGNRITSETA